MRTLVVVLLWVGCLFTALGVVHETHRARLATEGLEAERRQLNDLQIETGQLSLEISSLAAYSRVETLAAEQLRMVNPRNIRMVPLPKDTL